MEVTMQHNNLKMRNLPHSFPEDEVLLPMQEEVPVLVSAALTALTSQILNGIADPDRGGLQSAGVGVVVVEVWDANALTQANLNAMSCSGAIFGSACDAKRKKTGKTQLQI